MGAKLKAVTGLRRYQKVGLLGQGGMGQVYLAFDRILERYVALKQISQHVLRHPENATLLAYFEREAKVVASLQHPNIIQVYEYANAEPEPAWLVTEFVDGLTFEELTESLDGLEPVDVLAAIHPVAEALEYAHERDIIHRDLKPGNVMLSRHGRVFLMDFGLAKPIGGSGLKSMIIGSPSFMSPEQVDGQPTDARADIFAFGLLAYTLRTAELFFAAEAPRAFVEIMAEEYPRPEHLARLGDPTLEQLVTLCVQRDPARRAASMTEVLSLIEVGLASHGVGSASRAIRRRAAEWAGFMPQQYSLGDPAVPSVLDTTAGAAEAAVGAGAAEAAGGADELVAGDPVTGEPVNVAGSVSDLPMGQIIDTAPPSRETPSIRFADDMLASDQLDVELPPRAGHTVAQGSFEPDPMGIPDTEPTGGLVAEPDPQVVGQTRIGAPIGAVSPRSPRPRVRPRDAAATVVSDPPSALDVVTEPTAGTSGQEPGSIVDAGVVDAGVVDAGVVGAGLVDAGVADAEREGRVPAAWPPRPAVRSQPPVVPAPEVAVPEASGSRSEEPASRLGRAELVPIRRLPAMPVPVPAMAARDMIIEQARRGTADRLEEQLRRSDDPEAALALLLLAAVRGGRFTFLELRGALEHLGLEVADVSAALAGLVNDGVLVERGESAVAFVDDDDLRGVLDVVQAAPQAYRGLDALCDILTAGLADVDAALDRYERPDAEALLEQLAVAAGIVRAVPVSLRARLALRQAEVDAELGHPGRARERLEDVLVEVPPAGALADEARQALAAIHLRAGRVGRALALIETDVTASPIHASSDSLDEDGPDAVRQGRFTHLRGAALLQRGELSEAHEALRTARRLLSGDPDARAVVALDLGRVRWWLGDVLGALDAVDAARAHFDSRGDVRWEARACALLGWMQLEAGALDKAEARLEEAMGSARPTDEREVLCDVRRWMAELSRRRGQLEEAARHARRALSAAEALRDPRRVPAAHLALGLVLGDLGELAAAARHAELAAEGLVAWPLEHLEANLVRARLALREGAHDAAEAFAREAVRDAETHGASAPFGNLLLSELAARRGDRPAAHAARLAAARGYGRFPGRARVETDKAELARLL